MAEPQVEFLTIAEQGRLIQEGALSPLELTQRYLDRIDQLDGKLHAFNTVLRDQALAAAERAEQEIASGRYRGPLHGIPIAVKDQMDLAEAPNTGGSRVYRDNLATGDATIVARLKEAGAVFLGTLATHEFHMGTTQRFLTETPRNPWGLDRTPGGSSAGSASSVAAGLCSGSLGGDTGGSIRGPASFCGLTGLRPSWSLLSRHGIFSLAWSMDTAGPMARSAEDVAIMLQAMAGYDYKDPTTAPGPVPDFLGELDGSIQGLRVGVLEQMMDDSIEGSAKEAADQAVQVLKEQGARVEHVSIPILKETRHVHTAVVDAEAASYHRKALRGRYQDFDYNTRVRLMVGAALPAGLHTLALRAKALVGQSVIDLFDKVDIVVGATNRGPAPVIPRPEIIQSKAEAADRLWSATRGGGATTAFSMAGASAISIPCGYTPEGLPLGFHLAARPMDDARLLRVCHAFQQATAWHTRHPDL